MRYFTLAQAERALPAVERFLRDALFHKAEYQRVHTTLDETVQRIRSVLLYHLLPARQSNRLWTRSR